MKWFLVVPLAALLSACSQLGEKSGDEYAKPQQQYAATVHILPYVDGRHLDNPRKIGIGGENLFGFDAPSGSDILLKQEVAALVEEAMKRRFTSAGYQVVDRDAMFELGGTVQALSYNVKARDEVSIAIQSELKDARTGKLLWAGLVTQKEDRFAGVSGNSMSDVVKYLNKELGIVTRKTSEAAGEVLMAQHPELFNILPGSKVIPGVAVLNAATSAVPALPAIVPSNGVLVIGSEPKQAKVTIDEVYYGTTPLRLDMEPGIHAVSVELDGYRKVVQKVSVRKGETTELDLQLKKR